MRRVRPTLTTSIAFASSVRTADTPFVSCSPSLVVREEEVQTSETSVVMEEIVVHGTLTNASEQISKTQKWCLLKANQNQSKYGEDAPVPKRSQKVYGCGECGQVRSKLHYIAKYLQTKSICETSM